MIMTSIEDADAAFLQEPLNARHTSEGNTSECSDDFAGPLYVPGPLDGSLYAQVDKRLKKQIRSYSLDSGIPSRTSNGGDIFDKPNLKHSYDSRFGPRRAAQETATLNRYQFTRNSNNKVHSDGDIAMEPDFGGKIQSIEKLLKELGECSDLLDNTIQQGKKASDRTKPLTFQELSSAPLDCGRSDRPIYPPTPLRRTASYGATERYQERHAVPAKVARTLSRPNQSENYQRNPQNGNAWSPFPDPTSTSTPNKSSSLHRAPTLQPHASSLSPTFYASKVVMPHKTTIGQSYVPGDPANPANPNGNPVASSIEVHLAVNGYHDNDVDMAPSPSSTQKLNGKGGMGGSHSDTNNNAPDSAPAQNGTFENEENGTENEGESLPRKGNVAAKVAYLTEIVFPALPPEARNPPRKGTVPMPGLVSKSPGDISDEISKYNAKSLAVGELSHSSGVLYRGGAPQKISDIHPGPKDRANSELDAELAEKLKAVRERSVSAEITDQQEAERDLISRSNEAENESTGSPPVFVNNGPREFIIGEPISFTIPPNAENDAEDGRSDGSSISELLEEATPADNDDDSYAHVEDVQAQKHVTRMEENRPSPIVICKDTCNEPPMVAVLSERPCTSPEEMEAIDGILSEMADINLEMPVEGAECPLIAARPATPQTPSSSVSGPFDNSPTKKKRSPYHSDKGYGSTNSLSSDSSVNDVFIESPPPVPGVKFDKDTSQFWYKPSISRDQAINLLKDKEPGYFVVRDSQSFPGAYGLAVRVAVPPPHVLQGDLTKVDLASELIRHFLIESTKKGVKLKGISNEPVFGSLSAFVFQHTITPLSLPIRLAIPAQDLMPEITLDRQDGGTSSSPTSPTADTMKLMFVGECGVEMLSGTSAIQKTVESLLTYAASPKFTSTSFRITKQGITVTDNERKVFFRKHFQMSSVLYCGIDPLDQRWDLKIPSFSQKSRTFGLVVRKMGEIGNDCHLFAEMDESSPVNTVVNLVNRFMN